MAGALLDITGLSVMFHTEDGPREVLHDISLQIGPGEILGLVGESGSGKSATALAIMRLLAEQGRISAGRIALDRVDLLGLDAEAIRAMPGRDGVMIFQEPMTSLNPLITIGLQIEESLHAHLGLRGRQARRSSDRTPRGGRHPQPASAMTRIRICCPAANGSG